MARTLVFNGVNLNDLFAIGNIQRPLPEFVAAATKVDGADGESFDSLTVGTRRFSFDVMIGDKKPEEVQDAARSLAAALLVRSPQRFSFSDERDRYGNQLYRFAVPTGVIDVEEFLHAGKWTVEMVQHDPYLYGRSRSVVLAANEPKRFDVGGNAPATPYVTANPTGTKYTLQNGSKYVSYAGTFASGSTMKLDFKTQRASVSPEPQNNKGLQVGSRFFEISGTTTLSATDSTTVTWTERWI